MFLRDKAFSFEYLSYLLHSTLKPAEKYLNMKIHTKDKRKTIFRNSNFHNSIILTYITLRSPPLLGVLERGCSPVALAVPPVVGDGGTLVDLRVVPHSGQKVSGSTLGHAGHVEIGHALEHVLLAVELEPARVFAVAHVVLRLLWCGMEKMNMFDLMRYIQDNTIHM